MALQYAVGALLASSSFFAFTSAQNTNTTFINNQTCSSPLSKVDYNTPVNATGRVGFRWSRAPNNATEWYLSTILNDSSVQLQGVPFISVPESTGGEICVYKFAALNITATSGAGNNGCAGILTQTCINALRDVYLQVARPSLGSIGPLRCSPRDDLTSIRSACGESLLRSDTLVTPFSRQFKNSTCAIPSPPGVTVPENYTTFPLEIGAAIPNPIPDNTTMYDLYTRQTVPWVIAAFLEKGSPETAVVCVAPSDIKQGSRVPQGQWPPAGSVAGPVGASGSAASRGSQYVGCSALLAAGVAMMMLVL